MEQWRKDTQRETVIVDFDALVPQDHLRCFRYVINMIR